MSKILAKVLVVVGMSLLLWCCHSAPKEWQAPGHPAVDGINTSMSDAVLGNQVIAGEGASGARHDVTNALLPSLQLQSSKAQPLQRFDVAVNALPVQNFFIGLVKDTSYNIIVDPAVEGTITLNLKQVTLPEVLDALQDAYGYEYKMEAFGIYVTKGGLESHTFKVHYINLERSGESITKVNSGELTSEADESTSSTSESAGGDSPSSSIHTKSQSDFWKVLSETVNAMVGDVPGSKVVVNAQAGLVMVKAPPHVIKEVASYLDDVQSAMIRQVVIEAKILDIRLSKEYQAGIDWNVLGVAQSGTQALSSDTSLPSFTDMFTLDIHDGSAFSMLINLLNTQGNVQVLSSPRISTLNNQKAVIKVGSDQYYITNISNTITGSSSTTENTQDVTLTPFFSGIALDVTPEISSNDEVILHIHPIVSAVTDNTIDYTINGESQEIPSAQSQIKETDNIVRAHNGQVVVIGGLMENRTSEYLGSTPYADETPFVGSLFRKTHQQSLNSELVILLKPMIANNDVWENELTTISDEFKKLRRGYHVGGFTNRFGNEGEYFQDVPPTSSKE